VGAVLVVNAGSTSLKLSLATEDGGTAPLDRLSDVQREDVVAVGHRIVHGGARFREPTFVDEDVRAALAELTPLAPLHNAPALAALDDARRVFPDVPHIAVFDTAFHATLPEEAARYAIPRQWSEEWGIRRYGFHGLSVQWATEHVRVSRLVVCHLGGGSSVTAVRDGRSVDTTMGFSPLEGVPMATRSGSVDPGALVHLLRYHGFAAEKLDRVLEHESGLRALSGRSGDVRELLEAQATGDPDARLALAVYALRVAGAVAAMAASLEGLDALVFTAGVGEHSPQIRERVCSRLRFLGVELDADANVAARSDANVSSSSSRVRIFVVTAREDLVIARAVRNVLASRLPG
jgi:acetate kinase